MKVESADDTASPRPWHVALISGTVLVLELSFIREIPAEVRSISYFTNLVFMASFFGLGLGCLLERARSVAWLLPAGLAAVAAFVWFARGLVVYEETEAVHYWLDHDLPLGVAPNLPLFGAAALAFVASALPFVALGQRLAITMNVFPRLVAYGWDIFGSLAGTLIFVASSALRVPPWCWPLALMLIASVVLLRGLRERVLHVAAGALFLAFAQSPYPATWSPYYYIQHREEARGLRVWVNSSFHQLAVNLDPKRADLAKLREQVTDKFGTPYATYRKQHGGHGPESVLILGAGTGNDVNIALANGARRVVAVEIDPAILELGKAKNPTRPYADPRVTAVVDDARHYLHSEVERFDMIVFGTLDSQTLLSSTANLRLENYVYTQESFRDVARRLTDHGMVAAYYSVFRPWLVGRLHRTICDNFPGHCALQRFGPALFNTLFIAGPLVEPTDDANELRDARPSTDDWPFLYLEQPTVAPVYLQLMAAILALIAGVFVWYRRATSSPPHLDFLFLGMGFTLMESAAVVRLALLFGSTWIVNAVVFSSVLAMVFLGNLAVLRGRAPRLTHALLALLGCIALNYAIDPGALVGLDGWLRVLSCVVLIGSPVFFASVSFSRLFAAQLSTGHALGINLIGAMAGGFAEYVSMLVGMRGVWLLIAAVYLLAALFAQRAAGPVVAAR